MAVNIPIRFLNKEQEDFFNCTSRNQLASGGLGSGKTYIICLKVLLLMQTFPKYRVGFARGTYRNLKRTSMSTFFKICPKELYDEKRGGRRSDNDGHLRFTNGSELFWIGLDSYDEQTLKGLEVNAYAVDQAEELAENIYLHLDSRIDRWEVAEVPAHLLHLNFPLHPITGKPKPPAYAMLGCNPDSEEHWLWKRYHPDSPTRRPNHAFFNFLSEGNPALSPETLAEMKSRDKAWVDRFVYGKWGITGGTIHRIDASSIINPPSSFLKEAIKKGEKYRILDHGESAPTCCLWVTAYKNWHIVYREYYQPDALVSEHRKNIHDYSMGESYVGDYADPSIFKLAQQKFGGRWCVADEYSTASIDAPPFYWQPAENNELVCRSQVSELLQLRADLTHPLTGESPAPSLYFVQKTEDYPYGCHYAIRETKAQKRKKIGEEDGKDIFSDAREDRNVPDHAYDCVRYYAALRATPGVIDIVKRDPNSFMAFRTMALSRQQKLETVPTNLYRV